MTTFNVGDRVVVKNLNHSVTPPAKVLEVTATSALLEFDGPDKSKLLVGLDVLIPLTEHEARIERDQVVEVFGLGGGELEDEPVTFVSGFREKYNEIEETTEYGLKWRYHYDGPPEWADEDFDRDERNSASGDIFTLIDIGCEYGYRANRILIDSNDRIYLHVATYDHSGERECPFREWDAENRTDVEDPPAKVTYKRCDYCEADVGEEHGYIYLGACAEHVYRFVGFVRDAHPMPPHVCGGCPECDDEGLKPTDFQIHDHGPNHAQYFTGHGLAFSKFKDCATGCSFTPEEALDDALEQLAQNGWNVDPIDDSVAAKEIKANTQTVDDWHDCGKELPDDVKLIKREDGKFEVPTVEGTFETEADATAAYLEENHDRLVEGCEHQWYVSVDVR